MKQRLMALPVWLVLADMGYTFGWNVLQSVALQQEKLPADGLPVAPAIAFSWLQVLVNGGMVLMIGLGLLVLLRLNRTVSQGKAMPIGVWATLGLLAVMAFSVPAWWEWGWAAMYALQGHITFSGQNPRYLVVALCQLWIAWLSVSRLLMWYRLAKQSPLPTAEPPEAA